jgi:hypothetical protein
MRPTQLHTAMRVLAVALLVLIGLAEGEWQSGAQSLRVDLGAALGLRLELQLRAVGRAGGDDARHCHAGLAGRAVRRIAARRVRRLRHRSVVVLARALIQLARSIA